MINNEHGRLGEDIAAEFYQVNGFRIVARNYRSRHYEVDIIAENDFAIAFAEVKTRTYTDIIKRYGGAKGAVNYQKQQRLVAAARNYLRDNGNPKGKDIRMDVIEVYLTKEGTLMKLNYLKSAFGAKGVRL